MWAEAGDEDGVTEEGLLARRLLVVAVGHEVPVSMKGYVKLLRSLDGEAREKHSKCEATTKQTQAQASNVEEL